LQSLADDQQAMSAATASIEAANHTIPDMLSTSRDALRRQSGTLTPLGGVAKRLRLAARSGLEQFETNADAPGMVPNDLLEDILARGCLRVAVEPAFWGLSFRLQRGEALRGLDVDYAQAFAAYLGVKLELVEQPWEECPPLLQSGRTPRETPVDLMWSALVPSAAYHGLAYSEPYMHLNFVLVRRTGDATVSGLPSLQGRVLGCLNDPAAARAALGVASWRYCPAT
jgi:ABC-type amino acid transport substrate-binding protein